MPTMEYFLSAHATPNAQHSVAVPFPISFYVPLGQILPNGRAFDIFRNLSQGVTPGGRVDYTTAVDEMVPNYAIWNLSEYPDFSGVFAVGSDHRSISLDAYTQQNPLTLGQLVQLLPQASRLYWVACA